MKVKWEYNDKEDPREFTLTPRFMAALVEVLKSEVSMMREQDSKYAECWHWGRCYVRDLCGGIRFEFGAEEDMPKDGLGQFAVAPELERLL